VVDTEHKAPEHQAFYADLQRAKDLLEEISRVRCDNTTNIVLEGF